jgi:hypothetical protein
MAGLRTALHVIFPEPPTAQSEVDHSSASQSVEASRYASRGPPDPPARRSSGERQLKSTLPELGGKWQCPLIHGLRFDRGSE